MAAPLQVLADAPAREWVHQLGRWIGGPAPISVGLLAVARSRRAHRKDLPTGPSRARMRSLENPCSVYHQNKS